MKVIFTEKLTKHYGKNRGIIDVDLSVEEGEVYGFIGPNGAGKSTTIKLLLDFIKPTSGRCSIFGLDCQTESHEIKKNVGYIPAEVSYYDGMRVQEILAYSARYYQGDFSVHTQKLCKALDLDVTRKVQQLSTGNKKKVAIVQAMLHQPKLLIMDEPTAGLDPLMQHAFYGLIKETQQNGATIFFSSHVLGEVQRVCDRVALIRDGRLITAESLGDLSKTQYKKVKITAESDFEIKGAEHINRRNGVTEFLYKGSAQSLLAALQPNKIQDVFIEEPSLEDVFMAYYREGGK